MPPESSAQRGSLSRRSVLGGAGLGLLALTLGACSSRETVTAATSGTGSAGFTVTDMRGVQVRFNAPVQRIATTVIPSPSIIAAVDGSYDRIVGINESTRQADQQGLFGEIFPAARTTTTVAQSSFVPNIETITELNPDVVFQWADRGDEIIEPLENAGFTTVGLRYGTQEDLENWVVLFAEILGKPDRGTAIIEWMHSEEARLKKVMEGVTTPVRAVHLKQSGQGFEARSGKTYAQHWITLAGGRNVAENNLSPNGIVSAEQLIEWDPEIITLGGFDERTPHEIYEDPALAPISAVRNRRVYKAPLGGYRWEVPCAESPLMWQWAAEIFHPERVGHDLRATMAERIKYLYGYDVSEQQIDRTLRVDVNRDSLGYQVFEA